MSTALELARLSVSGRATVVLGGSASTPFPANALKVGSTFHLVLNASCTLSNADTSTWTLRFGSAGTTADASIGTFAVVAAGAGRITNYRVEVEIVVKAVGATGQVFARFTLWNNGTSGVSANSFVAGSFTVTATLDTTAAGYLSLTYKTSAATTNSIVHAPSLIDVVKI